jgi:hypothetical protein
MVIDEAPAPIDREAQPATGGVTCQKAAAVMVAPSQAHTRACEPANHQPYFRWGMETPQITSNEIGRHMRPVSFVGLSMNWSLIRMGLLIALLLNAFLLGRMSIEFGGKGSDWLMLFFIVVTVLSCLIGLAAGELVREKKPTV